MDEEVLNQKLEAMTRAILNGMEELHKDLRKAALRDKQEVFDKIAETRGELLGKLASSEVTEKHERRLQKLETQLG